MQSLIASVASDVSQSAAAAPVISEVTKRNTRSRVAERSPIVGTVVIARPRYERAAYALSINCIHGRSDMGKPLYWSFTETTSLLSGRGSSLRSRCLGIWAARDEG